MIFVVQHDLNIAIALGHQLGHQLPAGTAGWEGTALLINGDDLADLIFSFGEHMENGIALGADAKGTGTVHTYGSWCFSCKSDY